MLISEKQCRQDLEHSETSLFYIVLSPKVPPGQAYQKITRDYQMANFTFKKNQAKDSIISAVILDCSQNKMGGKMSL